MAGTIAGAWAGIGLSAHIGESGDFGVSGVGGKGELGLTFDAPAGGEEFGGWGIGGSFKLIAIPGVAGAGVSHETSLGMV